MNILSIVPLHQIFPADNGGRLRNLNLLKQFSKFSTIEIITYQNNLLKELADEIGIPFQNIYVLKKYSLSLQSRLIWKFRTGFFKPLDMLEISMYYLLNEIPFKNYDFVVIEGVIPIYVLKLLRRKFKDSKFIIDFHNVDSILLEKLSSIKNKENSLKAIKYYEAGYKNLWDYAFTCSDLDRNIIRDANRGKPDLDRNIVTIPNGVASPVNINKIPSSTSMNNLLFCGSMDYRPNEEGLIWFVDHIAPLLKQQAFDFKLTIIGNGSPSDQLLMRFRENSYIDFRGHVESVKVYYENASISIVPLLTGSGTRLKILEAMAFEIPLVSTSKGAEGVNYTKGFNILISDTPEAFARSIILVCSNASIKRCLAENGKALIESQYEWNIIGESLQNTLRKFCRKAVL